MKILKRIGLILAALIGLILIVAIFLPKDVSTTQSTTINAPVETVFNAVNDFSQWENWSVWAANDSTMVTTLAENYVGEGGSYSWKGDVVGEGNMKILSSDPNKEIKTAIQFGPMGSANGHWMFSESENGTEVQWDVVSHFGYPFNIMLLMSDFESMMSKEFTKGLTMLKDHTENVAANEGPAYEVQEVDLPISYYIGIREEIEMETLSSRYAENLPKVFAAVMENGIEPAGMPCGVFFHWDEETKITDVLQGAPIKTNSSIDGFTTMEFPASKALVIDYYGDYHGLRAAHMAMDKYIKAKGLTHVAPAIEQYVTDPGTQPDTTQWLTKVTYYLK